MRVTEGLDLNFEKLMVFGENMSGGHIGGGGMGGGLGGGVRITEWKDIPVELLLRILSLVDDQTVILASGVCHGWRDAISWGLTHLSLSWYMLTLSLLSFPSYGLRFLVLFLDGFLVRFILFRKPCSGKIKT